jgi:hypothetical protein
LPFKRTWQSLLSLFTTPRKIELSSIVRSTMSCAKRLPPFEACFGARAVSVQRVAIACFLLHPESSFARR